MKLVKRYIVSKRNNTLLSKQTRIQQYRTKLQLKSPVPNDIEISQSVAPLHIKEIASELGITEDEMMYYGNHKCKVVSDKLLKRLEKEEDGKYIVVAGISPTPLGEGKTTTAIGISQALGAHMNKKVVACLRQPSMGPVFGLKGGASGGGYSQIIPMEELNLHLTGDIHAVTAANNLMAAAIDTRLFHESTQKDEALFNRLCPADEKTGKRHFSPIMYRRLKRLGINKQNPEDLTREERAQFARLDIDANTISWNRVLDVCDRFLRRVTLGKAPTEAGHERDAGFDIAVASELMAILALSNDLHDMRQRIGNIVFADSKRGEPLTADDLGVAGAATAIMKESIHPTLMQTIEGTATLIHAGPFANIAHGNSSIIADKVALKVVGRDGYVLTEAGFGADIGMEKFFNIKCRTSGLKPAAVCLVASVRALKYHGGGSLSTLQAPSVEQVRLGSANLVKHIQNIKLYGVPCVVCINKFKSDTEEELNEVAAIAKQAGAFEVAISNHWEKGGAGAVEVSDALIRACKEPTNFDYLYPLQGTTIKQKIETIATKMYSAKDVSYTPAVEEKIARFTSHGFSELPICIAKTQYSFSDNPELRGAPSGFTLPINDIRVYSGAGIIVPLVGKIVTIPGLPTRPAYYDIDLDANGNIEGLF